MDTVCFHLFDRTAHAWKQVAAWERRKGEYQRRAAFALLSVGSRNRALNAAALGTAERLAASDAPTARRIGKSARRRVVGEAVRKRSERIERKRSAR